MGDRDFDHFLSLTARYPHMGSWEKRKTLLLFHNYLQTLKKRAAKDPEDYRHKYLLALAEKYRLKGQAVKAGRLYEQAVQAAGESGRTEFKAMVHERAAAYFQQLGLLQAGAFHFLQAIEIHSTSGAIDQVRQLERTYPKLAALVTGIIAPAYDLSTVLNAAQSLSGEILLDRLLSKMIKTVVAYTGVRRGLFFLPKNGIWSMEAEYHVDKLEPVVLQSMPLEQCSSIPLSVFRETLKTGMPVLLQNASVEEPYAQDPFILQNAPKSILCMPVMQQGKLTGMLYLENGLLPGVFTLSRLKVMELLCTQIAIAVENARLYAQMEEQVRKRTQRLRETNQELMETNLELIRMETSRRSLLSNISHDLGTPMTSIQGYVEALLDDLVEDPAKQRRYLEAVHARILAMNRLIQDLLQLSRLEAGQLDFHPREVDAVGLIRLLYKKYEPEMEKAGLSSELVIDNPVERGRPLRIFADTERIEQVFSNLISNALKYASAGRRITVRLTLEKSPSNRRGEDQVCFAVEDQGMGISEEDLPYIFDRFYKGNKSRQDGSGLGLAICREIIEHHKGRIWVESEPGKGSRFYFTLPLRGGQANA